MVSDSPLANRVFVFE